MPLDAAYRLCPGMPTVEEYLQLRELAGLTARTRRQAAAAQSGAWAAAHVRHAATGAAVGMGRMIGDGAWYFHVLDMAVLPDHQRRGVGGAVLTWLLDRVREGAPPGAYVTLLADEPGRGLYGRHGFVPTAPASIGMHLRTL